MYRFALNLASKSRVATTRSQQVVANLSRVYPKDLEFPESGVDDTTKLTYLHEPGVQTYTANILIAINPFKRIPNIYDKDVMEKYKGVALGELSPHPYAIANMAYRQIVEEGVSQSILVSGESGAGRPGSNERSVEQQVLESNPVLEAFGNAKTVRNNNSSRFGKFVEIQFNDQGRISGAAIRTYLLERSRVCQVSDPERSYHCFYMLCAAPPEVIGFPQINMKIILSIVYSNVFIYAIRIKTLYLYYEFDEFD